MSYNPVKHVFDRVELYGAQATMTVSGTLWKMGLMLAALGVGAVSALMLAVAQPSFVLGAALASGILGMCLAMVSVFWPHYTRFTALPYAFCQGVSLTFFSLVMEVRYPGIAVISLLLTSATAVAMLFLYTTRIIRVTETFRSVIIAATGGIALTYMAVLLMGLFGFNTSYFFQSSSLMSIGFSLFVVGIAAFSLLLDFSLIEESVEKGMPKFMEWYSAFALMVTLIWLYVEMARLLSKLSRRRD